MKIKSKIQIIYILPIVLVVVVVLSFIVSYKTMSRINSRDLMVEAIITGAFELNMLTADYVRHPAERPKGQWNLKHASITKLLATVHFEEEEERSILKIIQDNHREIRVLFEELLDFHGERESLQETADVSLAYKERLIGQILIRSQALVSNAERLSHITHIWMMNYYVRLGVITICIIGILMLSIFSVSFYFGKSIVTSILNLHNATNIIAGGNLDYKIGNYGNDEIGELSLSFDEMTINLKKSRMLLQDEINERKKAEEELKKYKGNLEDIVAKRTKQLQAAQDELIQSERLSVLGKLSSSLAHEINNPLGVIDSSVYYLKMMLKDADEKTLDHLNRIKSQVDASTAIIESLRNLTRLKMPSKAQIDIADSIKEGMIKANVPEGVNVVYKMEKDGLTVAADTQQLAMVFRNLTENAVQGMEGKGTLWVNASVGRDDLIEVTFRDSGPGIAPDHLEKIFQPFFTTKASGIGFGLALCKIIVERHGGSIVASSEEGKGATLTVRLPSLKQIKGLK